MNPMQPDTQRTDQLRALGDFFRAKRRTMSPDLRGVVTTRRRLVPGLSRDEVAAIADIGTTWYARLEAGRVAKPTLATIRAVSTALELNDAEHRFVLGLAGLLPPITSGSPGAVALASLAALVHEPSLVALSIWDRFLTPTGWNNVADAMYGFSVRSTAIERHPVLRLEDPQTIAFFGAHHESYARNLVGMFRRAYVGGEPPAHARHVYAVAQSIALFRKYWDQHVVSDAVTDPNLPFERHHWIVGRFTATSTDLVINDEHTLLRILAPTDDTSREAFARLATLGTSSTDSAADPISQGTERARLPG